MINLPCEQLRYGALQPCKDFFAKIIKIRKASKVEETHDYSREFHFTFQQFNSCLPAMLLAEEAPLVAEWLKVAGFAFDDVGWNAFWPCLCGTFTSLNKRPACSIPKVILLISNIITSTTQQRTRAQPTAPQCPSAPCTRTTGC